jgi:hypothetical protein
MYPKQRLSGEKLLGRLRLKHARFLIECECLLEQGI